MTKKGLLLTRNLNANQQIMAHIDKQRFTVYSVPLLEFSQKKMEPLTREQRTCQWLFFTSSNSVTHFFQQQPDLTWLKNIKIAVIGTGTQRALTQWNFGADFMPTEYSAEGMVKQWQVKYGKEKQHILLPKSDLARSAIKVELIGLGHQVTERIVYRNQLPVASAKKLHDLLVEQKIQIALFTSPSAWHRFLDVYQKVERADVELVFGAIGPVTATAIHKSGYDAVTADGKDYTMKLLCQTMGLC